MLQFSIMVLQDLAAAIWSIDDLNHYSYELVSAGSAFTLCQEKKTVKSLDTLVVEDQHECSLHVSLNHFLERGFFPPLLTIQITLLSQRLLSH